MNEGFHAIGFVALADIPFVPVVATLPVLAVLERGAVTTAAAARDLAE